MARTRRASKVTKSNSSVCLTVPASPSFARSVRMMAANLAVLCPMNVDEVEDARMAAEEAFVYACATKPASCEIAFSLADDSLAMTFSLGDTLPKEGDESFEQVSFAELLLSAVSDSYEMDWDRHSLHVIKRAGGSHGA